MKKNKLFYVMMISGLFISGVGHAAESEEFVEEEVIFPEQTFEDKPALSRAERAALMGAKGIGLGVGGLGGGLSALLAAGVAMDKMKKDKDSPKYGVTALAGFFGSGPATAATGYAGYKGAEWAAVRALAKLHGVSSRIEAVSQFYNINAPLYRALLGAAELKDLEQILSAINELYAQRFGGNWQERLQKLFKKYRRKGKRLVEKGSFSLEGDERDFVRMVELGAAMENLYADTQPKKKATIGFAKELYEDLGLLK